MNMKSFLNKHLTKTQKAKCNSLGQRYRRLEERAERDESDSFHGGDEPSVIRDKIIELMSPAVKRYAKEIFKKPIDEEINAVPFEFYLGDDYMEISCVKRGKKGWVASVETSYWDAPSHTCDDSTCVPTPADAFEWGFGDAMAYHFINERVK
jgi:hypothetical protein